MTNDEAMSPRDTPLARAFAKPAYWTNTPPPAPQSVESDETLSPTRYGDWVKDGLAVDF